jgi:hypothetical protein
VAHDDRAGPSVTVERLADVVDWEAYRLLGDDDVTVLCTIALRHEDGDGVAYAVWRPADDEPGATGRVAALRAGWGDLAREDAIRQIAFRYEEDLRIAPDDLAFRLEGDVAGEDEDGADESDGDEGEDDQHEDEDE